MSQLLKNCLIGLYLCRINNINMIFSKKTIKINHQQGKVLFLSVIFSCAVFFSPFSHALDIGNKSIIGGSEKIIILPGEMVFKAKIDTGAKNSSMHATNIEIFTLSEKKFVRFNTDNLDGKSITLELPLVRIVRIKRHKQEAQKRPVVKIGICLGSVYKIVEVSLTDRSKFSKRFLIGETFLIDDFLIDLNQIFTAQPRCDSIAG